MQCQEKIIDFFDNLWYHSSEVVNAKGKKMAGNTDSASDIKGIDLDNNKASTLKKRVKEVQVPLSGPYVSNSVMYLDEQGIPTSQRIDFDFEPFDTKEQRDQFSLTFHLTADSKDTPKCTGEISLQKNGEDISFFDVNDADLIKMLKHFPELDTKCPENPELSERLLCIDAFKEFEDYTNAVNVLSDLCLTKGYASAGITAKNFLKFMDGLDHSNANTIMYLKKHYFPSDNCETIEELKHNLYVKMGEKIGDNLKGKPNNRNKKVLTRLNNRLNEEYFIAPPGEDLLKEYFFEEKETWMRPLSLCAALGLTAVPALKNFELIPGMCFICGIAGSALVAVALEHGLSACKANKLKYQSYGGR